MNSPTNYGRMSNKIEDMVQKVGVGSARKKKKKAQKGRKTGLGRGLSAWEEQAAMTKSKVGESRASVCVRQHFPTNNVRNEAFRRHPFAYAASPYILYDSIQTRRALENYYEQRPVTTVPASYLQYSRWSTATWCSLVLILILIHPRP